MKWTGCKPRGAGRAQTALALVLGRPGIRRQRSVERARSRRPAKTEIDAIAHGFPRGAVSGQGPPNKSPATGERG